MFGREKERDEKISLANCTITTIVGSDTIVEGTIITKSSVRIDGTLIGGVSAEGIVILSKNGKIRGNIMAENIIVAGVVEGNMQIREKVDVEPTGEIYGDITTKKLLIDEESIFQGNCFMNRERQSDKAAGKAEEIYFKEQDEQEPEALPKEEPEPAQEPVPEEEPAADEDVLDQNMDLDGIEEEEELMALEEEELPEDEDMDFLDVNIKRNRNTAGDNKRRRR